MPTYAIGHTPPDTDSVCSPIAYAWFKKEKKGEDVKAVIGADINRETKFILEHFDVETPEKIDEVKEGDKLIILDTTNPEELIKGYDETEILEIIDHHKLGGLKTETPLEATIKPWGCTATILWYAIKDEAEDIPKEMAGLLASAIISDTLNLTSPTTTEHDKAALDELSQKAQITVKEFAEKMFEAKSDLSGMSAEEILEADPKTFEFSGKKTAVNVMETVKPGNALEMQDELIKGMKSLKEKNNADLYFFFVIDIMKKKAHLLISGDEEEKVARQAFGKGAKDEVMEIEGVVSRKKQIIPVLEKALA